VALGEQRQERLVQDMRERHRHAGVFGGLQHEPDVFQSESKPEAGRPVHLIGDRPTVVAIRLTQRRPAPFVPRPASSRVMVISGRGPR
jgi:hypothetical protein